jgi:hypothetical protein
MFKALVGGKKLVRTHCKLLCRGTSAENRCHEVQTYNLDRAKPSGSIKMHVNISGREKVDDTLLRAGYSEEPF